MIFFHEIPWDSMDHGDSLQLPEPAGSARVRSQPWSWSSAQSLVEQHRAPGLGRLTYLLGYPDVEIGYDLGSGGDKVPAIAENDDLN